jgi:hypothetical protein
METIVTIRAMRAGGGDAISQPVSGEAGPRSSGFASVSTT